MAKRRPALNSIPVGRQVFLDSSVMFSAVYSVNGGSAKLFTLKNINLNVSKLVLAEVERNVREKLQSYHLVRFFMLVDRLNIVESYFSKSDVARARKVIVEKDAAILTDFIKSECSNMITLDKKDFLQEKVTEFVKPKKILTTKMFFEEYG